MKKIINQALIGIFFFISGCVFSQKNTVFNNWYKINNKEFIGYMHCIVTDNSSTYSISTEMKIKEGKDEVFFLNMESENLKDTYLTLDSFRLETNEKPELGIVIVLKGNIEKQEDSLVWNITGNIAEYKKLSKVTSYPTVDYFSLLFLLSQLTYNEEGRLLSFDSMETDELNYKENHYIEYKGIESIFINNRKIKAKKVIIRGGGIAGSTYWLDENNQVVKMAIDDSEDMVYIKCEEKDIDFNLYK